MVTSLDTTECVVCGSEMMAALDPKILGAPIKRLCAKCLAIAHQEVNYLTARSNEIHNLGLTQEQYTEVMSFTCDVAAESKRRLAVRLRTEVVGRFGAFTHVPISEVLRMLEIEAGRG